jgi:hypothetical protein
MTSDCLKSCGDLQEKARLSACPGGLSIAPVANCG